MGSEKTQFKPGNPGGPGKPKDPPEIKALKRLRRGDYKLLIYKYANKTQEQLKELANTSLPMVDLIIVKAMLDIAKRGDIGKFEYFLNRIHGKVKEELEVREIKPIVIRRPTGEDVVLDTENSSSEED